MTPQDRKRKRARIRMRALRSNPETRPALLKYQREYSRKRREQRGEAGRKYQRDYQRNQRLKVLGRRKQCAICRRHRPLVLDHCHKTAELRCQHSPQLRSCPRCRRGALCYGCNVGIAVLEKYGNKTGQYLRKWAKILNRRTTS